MKKPELSIVLPCRNEEKAIVSVLREIKEVIKENNIDAEIIVSDSSQDKSAELAKQEKVIVVKHNKEGYGNAYIEGFKKATGEYLLMMDCDGSYDSRDIPRFLRLLRQGEDFVMGNRFNSKMEKGAMPGLNKYIGNPILSSILRIFFFTKVKDSHCGMRAIKKEVLDKLNLHATGMEFASEMVIKAAKLKIKIAQTNITYRSRIGNSKLRRMSDGWRHLRFMLLYSPLFLFFIPGLAIFLIGIISFMGIYFSLLRISGLVLQVHPLFICSLLIILGYQVIVFSIFARTYAYIHLSFGGGWLKKAYSYFNLETSSIIGFLFIIGGLLVYAFIFGIWAQSNFGELNQIKNSILGMTLIIFGVQTIFSAFMLSILGIRER